MQQCDILIEGCRVLLPDMTISGDCTVVIDKKKIQEIGDPEELRGRYTGKTVLRGAGKLLMPGFTDAHTHVCQTLLRGRTADEYPMVWTRFLVPFESNLTPEDTFVSTQLACLEMIKSGTTSFAESGGVHMDQAAEAILQSGMRAALAKSTMDSGNVVDGNMKETAEEAIARTIELYNAYHGAGDGRLKVFFAIRQLMTCSEKLLHMIKEEADARNTGIHMHLCEHRDEVSFCLQKYRMRPAEFLQSMGLLSDRLLTAHSVMLTETDIQLLADNGVNIVHCPRSNLASHGFPNTPAILRAGGHVGFGSDGSASNGADLFDEMKVFRYSMLCHWGLAVFDPVVMTSETLFRMATQGGASALGERDTLGKIAVGQKADVILVNMHQPHLYPTQKPVSTLLDCACGRDVTDSIIDGKLVMKDREVLTLDEERIMYESREHMEAIIRRAYR